MILQRNPSYNALDELRMAAKKVSRTHVLVSAGSGGDQTTGKYQCYAIEYNVLANAYHIWCAVGAIRLPNDITLSHNGHISLQLHDLPCTL